LEETGDVGYCLRFQREQEKAGRGILADIGLRAQQKKIRHERVNWVLFSASMKRLAR
jgi:hypothetical protein